MPRLALITAPIVVAVLAIWSGQAYLLNEGERFGSWLAHVTQPPPTADAPFAVQAASTKALSSDECEAAALPRETAGNRSSGASGPSVSTPGSAKSPRGQLRGVRLSAERVLALANAGYMPQGRAVTRLGQRPGGIELLNVQGLGVGLSDGDVLVAVDGMPVAAPSDVVTRVLDARSQRRRSLTARVWQREGLLQLVVEVPYVDSSGRLVMAVPPPPKRSATGLGAQIGLN